MRQRAADGVGNLSADEGRGVCASWLVWIIAGQLQFFAALPPAVLAADYTRKNIRGHTRFDSDCASGAFDNDPPFVLDAVA